jgi:gliding motility-associated-like protein
MRTVCVALLLCLGLDAFAQGSGFALQGNTPAYVDCGPGMNDLVFPYTIEAWVNLEDLPSTPHAIWNSGIHPAGIYYGAWLVVGVGGEVVITYGDGTGTGGANRRSHASLVSIPLDRWVHICGVQEDSLNGRIYFNGVQVPTMPTGSGALTMVHFPGSQQTIGNNPGISGGSWLDGSVDEVRVWDDIRSDAEIRTYMCRRLEGSETDLAAYWRMDEGTGSSITDQSGNGHDGTLSGPMNWITSSAAIGDTSTYAYPLSWAGTLLTMPDAAGTEQMEVNEVFAPTGQGVHIYRVDTLPNTTTGLLPGTPDHYYGVFATDITATYTATARVLAPACTNCSLDWVARNANDAGPWLPLSPGTASPTGCSRRLTGESSIGDIWRSEYAWTDSILGPYTGMGDTLLVELCPGDSTFVDGSWTSVPGIYIDTLLTAEGCDSITGIRIDPLSAPGDTLIALSICTGDSAFLGGAWQSAAGIYLDTVAALSGCDSIVATDLDLAPLLIGTPLELELCAGDSTLVFGAWQSSSGVYSDTIPSSGACDSVALVSLTVLANSAGPVLDTAICANDSLFLEGAWQSSSGFYTDTLTNSLGCDSIQSTMLSIRPVAVGADLINTICEGDSVFAGGAWQTETGIYTETLTASNGCDSTFRYVLTVEPCPDTCRLMLPNAFSPNGDGINDGFGFPDAACVLDGPIQLDVFNRWGQRIFSTSSPEGKWDGTWKGKPQELGVYVWTLRYASPDTGENRWQQGTVTLIR